MLPEIPGHACAYEYQRELRRLLSDLIGSSNPDKFPGAQPISFAAKHLDELVEENYFVSEKADGIRVLMFLHLNTRFNKPETFLIDRKNNYYFQDTFWLPSDESQTSPSYDTILDAELVLDVDKDSGERTLWLLLFDCLVYQGKSLIPRPYMSRLGYLKEKVLKPFKRKMESDPAYRAMQPFKMDLKKLQLSYCVNEVFKEMPTLKHGSDGVIYTSSLAPYILGTCDKMLKWKPSDENTVDFKITVIAGNPAVEYRISLWLGGSAYQDHGVLTVSSSLRDSWATSPPYNRIAECKYDPDWPGSWKFMRWRDDKDNANHISTYEKIMESIRDNVDKQELLDRCQLIRDAWKRREQSVPSSSSSSAGMKRSTSDLTSHQNAQKRTKKLV